MRKLFFGLFMLTAALSLTNVQAQTFVVNNLDNSCSTAERIFWSSCLVSNWQDCTVENGRIFKAEDGFSFIENEDGTAYMQGVMTHVSDSEIQFNVSVNFSGRTSTPPSGSPKLEDCAIGQSSADWYYYPTANGSLIGMGKLEGGNISISRAGPSYQIGTNASLKTTGFGGSGWFNTSIVSQPNSGIQFSSGNIVDFNLDLLPARVCTTTAHSIAHQIGNVSHTDNILGQADGQSAYFDKGGSGPYTRIVVDLGETLPTGSEVCIKAKSSGGTAALTAWYLVSGDPETASYNPIQSNIQFDNVGYQDICVTLNAPTRYFKITDDGQTPFFVDAIVAACSNVEEISGWSFECGDDKVVDEYGYNANCQKEVNATIPNPENVYQYVVEIAYKGGNPGETIVVSDFDGNQFTLNRIQPMGTSSNIWVYRGLIDGSTSSVTYQDATTDCKLQSLVVYAFRNVANAGASSGVFSTLSGVNDIVTLDIPIPTDDETRTLVIEAPISELTTDGRYLKLTATAGTISQSQFFYGPDASLPGGTCCLAIAEITLENVPGNISTVQVEVDTRNNANGQTVNGQSWVIAGGVNVDVECATAAEEITEWYFECGDDKVVDEYGYNANCKKEVNATIPNPGNVYQYVVEIAYKGNSNPGETVVVTDFDGNQYTLERFEPMGSSFQVWVYRGLITGSTSSINYQDAVTDCNLQSVVVYAFRNEPNAGASSGVFSTLSGVNNIVNLDVPIPTDNQDRTLLIEAPISELTTDGRYLKLTATAGTVSQSQFFYGPDASLPGGTCCLAIAEITLENVPGNISTVQIEIDTRNNQNGQTVNGQSWVIAGGVNVDVECVECDGFSTAIVGDGEICNGESTTLTANNTGGQSTFNYLWSDGATTAAITVSPNSTTTYSVTVTDAEGCEVSDEKQVIVNPLPTANAGPDKEICVGESTALTASGGGTYLWSTGATTASITVSPSSTTTYTVSVTTSKGCTDTDEAIVTVNPLPTANAGPDKEICEGESTIITASGGGDYLWSTGATSASITVSPNITTTYTVTVTSNKGCSDTDETIVRVSPNFVSGINAPTTKCAEEEINIIADPAVVEASYNWTFSGPATPATDTSASVNVSWSAPGIYTISLTVEKNGCEETYSQDINITQAVFGSAGADTAICQGASATIGGNPTGPAGAQYVWTPNLFMNNNTVANPTVTPPVTTTYSVEVTQNGCTRNESVTVEIDIELNPSVDAGDDQTICLGAIASIGGPADPTVFYYQWSTDVGDIPGANSATLEISPTSSTVYYVTGYNSLGCLDIDTVLVNVNPAPPAPTGLAMVTACAGKPLPKLVVFVENGNSANWYDAPVNGNLLAEHTLTYQPTAPGNYYVVQTSEDGACQSNGRFMVEVTLINNCDDCNTPDCLGVAIE